MTVKFKGVTLKIISKNLTFLYELNYSNLWKFATSSPKHKIAYV